VEEEDEDEDDQHGGPRGLVGPAGGCVCGSLEEDRAAGRRPDRGPDMERDTCGEEESQEM